MSHALAHVRGSRRQINPCSWAQSEHGLHPLQHTQQALQRVRIKIAPHLDPSPTRQHYGQPCRYLLFSVHPSNLTHTLLIEQVGCSDAYLPVKNILWPSVSCARNNANAECGEGTGKAIRNPKFLIEGRETNRQPGMDRKHSEGASAGAIMLLHS